MATTAKSTGKNISTWAFKPSKGMRHQMLRLVTTSPSDVYTPWKTYFQGSAGPIIKMWDGTTWKVIGLT